MGVLVLQVFGHKAKYYRHENVTWWWRYMKGQRITEVIRIHPEGNMNVCTIFRGNPFNSCKIFHSQIPSSWWHNEKSEDHKSHCNMSPRNYECLYEILHFICLTYWWRCREGREIIRIGGIHLLGILDICTEFMAMYPIAVETFHSFIS